MKKEERLIKKVKRLLKRLKCPRYMHHFGPKIYEFYEHITALLIKEICRLSFRRASNILALLGVNTPSYSALCKSRKRFPFVLWNSLLQLTANFNSDLIAVDSTGFSRTNPSWHYVKRINAEKPVKSYVKLSALFDTKHKKFCALRVRARPRHDIKDFSYLLKKRKIMNKLLGDSAYDAESLHKKSYELGIITVIKPRKNAKRGFYRKKQMKNYSERAYHRRSMIESGFGGLKRKYGSYVLARKISAQRAEIYCRAIAHNLSLRF